MNIQLPDKPWHLAPLDLLKKLDVQPEIGLSQAEAAGRLASFGPNELHTRNGRTWPSILVSQFKSLLVLLLAVASILGFLFGDWVEGSAIFGVIIINATIGFFTELRAVRSMESLRQFNTTRVTVRRSREILRIAAEEMVPGDIVLIKSGDVIASDLRLISTSRLEANESLLTGESFPVSKSADLLTEDTILAERANMLFKGTSVTRGSAEAVVTATGKDTELGEISSLVLETEDEITPLEKRLGQLGRKLIIVTLVVTLFTFVMGLVSGKDFYLMIETSIALAVAAIPEGLPIIATLALARGMWRMARSNALINRLAAVETLGATNLICTDKTGTLTENKMTLDHVLPCAIDGHDEVLKIGILCNKSSPDGIGDPIEVALRQAAGQKEIIAPFPIVQEEAFDSESKRMATIHELKNGYLVAVKGAPEAIFPLCSRMLTKEGPVPLDDKQLQTWEDRNKQLAAEGFRLLAFAKKETKNQKEAPYAELTLVGLACFIDPPRHDIQTTLEQCHAAGIRVVMVTGDQAGTATHVARSVNISGNNKPPKVVTGKDLPNKSEQELLETDIFARVTPKDKLALVDLHQKNGSVVAMTGDGVNDAPALKKADIGIAMGQRGTEVAREAADMILRDDSFTTIITAIRQGRIIFDNIRKFVVYLMSCNLSEILIIGCAAGASAPLPLLPLQILFLNMVTDIFPAFALGASGGSAHVMKQAPRKMSEPLIGRPQWKSIIFYSLIISSTVLTCFGLAYLHFQLGAAEAVTISFLILANSQIFHVFNMSAPGTGILKNEITTNSYVWGATALCLLILAGALFIPFFAGILSLTPPSVTGWLLVIAGSLTPLVIGRAIQLFGLRGHRTTPSACPHAL